MKQKIKILSKYTCINVLIMLQKIDIINSEKVAGAICMIRLQYVLVIVINTVFAMFKI